MRIVVLDGYVLTSGEDWWAELGKLGELEVYDRSTPAEILERSRGATVLVTNKAVIGEQVLAAAPGVELIVVTATGHDCVDVAAATRAGIAVCNVPEYGTTTVAQFVFALLLELCHHVGLHVAAVADGQWEKQPDFSFWKTPQVSLAGKTIGIVGPGRIGGRVGVIAQALGMKVLAHSRSDKPLPDGFQSATLDVLFERSDVITLHCPLTPDTAGLVNASRLARMKPSAFLINTSRGALVVEADLATALRSGTLAGAALDVVSKEPISPDNPLFGAPRCLITPHMAWATREARQQLLATTVENVTAFLAGNPVNLVRA